MRNHFRSVMMLAAIAAILPSAPAVAQSDGWAAFRTEYKCLSVTRTTATQVTRLAFDRAGYRVSIGMRARPQGFNAAQAEFATIEYPAGSRPAHVFQATTRRTGRNEAWGEPEEAPQIEIAGAADVLDWVQRTNAFDYVIFGKRYTLLVEDLARARAALAACRPQAPPPNRAVRPDGGISYMVDLQAWRDLVPARTLIQKLFADLLVNDQGRVQKCTITASSGFAALDQEVCRQFTQNGRFVAATDAVGRHIASTYPLRVEKLQL